MPTRSRDRLPAAEEEEGTEAAGTGAVKEEAAGDWEGVGMEAAEGWEAAAREGEVDSEAAGSMSKARYVSFRC